MHDRYIKFLLVLEQGQVYKPSAATPEKKKTKRLIKRHQQTSNILNFYYV